MTTLELEYSNLYLRLIAAVQILIGPGIESDRAAGFDRRATMRWVRPCLDATRREVVAENSRPRIMWAACRNAEAAALTFCFHEQGLN